MNKLLVAITYHSQKRPTAWKSWLSADDPNCSSALFCYDRTPNIGANCFMTGEPSLGGKRNFAINYARANGYNLIAFLDDDDLFGPSWVKALLELEAKPKTIYHPQWNILFGQDSFKAHEHIASTDPRFDSRDSLLNNQWSALCAFDPMTNDILYRKHKADDSRESFEDWSFNLDTWCAGYEHAVLPNTFHFLRLRRDSLSKTPNKVLAHTEFFLDSELRNKTLASDDRFQDKYDIDIVAAQNEFRSIHEIEPQLYYWSQKVTIEIEGKEKEVDFEQQHYPRCEAVSNAVDQLGDFRGIRDVFWTIDHCRTGGAEKAINFASRFLARFPLGARTRELWIDDVVAAKSEAISATAWVAALRNVLKAWQDAPGSQARSIHICNSFMAWQVMTFNRDLFDKVQVYFYVFNDDLRFKSEKFEPDTKGHHSPLYRFAHLIDVPNYHIITDSKHFARRIHEKTGLGDKVRVIDIPVVQQECKRKDKPDSQRDILWAGRLDHWKGLEMVHEVAELLPENYNILVHGDGPLKVDDSKSTKLWYRGPYKSFEYINGKYDFMWFTSEREGMPNVVKEAMAAGLPVLARGEEWVEEMPMIASYPPEWNAEQIASLITKFDPVSFADKLPKFTFDDAVPRAMNAYKEALTWKR